MGERTNPYPDKEELVIKTSKYLYQFKDTANGCGAKKKAERVLSFTIPN